MKLIVVATIVIVVCSFVAATNTEKHLKSRSAAHPAHLRSKPLHPLAHNARSNSLTKREGSNETCYKICANETGSGGNSSLIVYISKTSVNAIYVSSFHFAFIYDYASKLIIIINTRTYASLIFNYTSGIGYYASGSVNASGIFSQSSNETIVEYFRSIEYSLNATWSVYVRSARRFTLSLQGSFSITVIEARILLSAFTRIFFGYSGTYSLSRWGQLVLAIHAQITAVFYQGYGVYEIEGNSYLFFLYHLIHGGFDVSGGGNSSGNGTGSDTGPGTDPDTGSEPGTTTRPGTGTTSGPGTGSDPGSESGSGEGGGHGGHSGHGDHSGQHHHCSHEDSDDDSDNDSSDESRRLTHSKNRVSRSKLRSYHNQQNLKARNHH